MLLQSWGNKIRVFTAVPVSWENISFDGLLAAGGFEVSAVRKEGKTQFVQIKSRAGEPCFVQTEIPNPKIYINGSPVKKMQARVVEDGMYQIALKKGYHVTFTPIELKKTDLSIEPVPMSEKDCNLFGLNEKIIRLSGYRHYYKK